MSREELDKFAAMLKRNMIDIPKGITLEVRDVDYKSFGVPEDRRHFSIIEYNTNYGVKFYLHNKFISDKKD